MLAQEVVRELGERVTFRVEDFGASPLAERFGVREYPAFFVDDALVARPQEFVAWGGAAGGKYVPWSKPKNRLRFQDDLRRMVRARLAGEAVTSAAPAGAAPPFHLPLENVEDLGGRSFSFASLAGKPLLIEVWASWCPPCLQSLRWLQTLDPAKASVVGIAVDSPPAEVRRLAAGLHGPARLAIGTPKLVAALGGVSAYPTLLLIDGRGKLVRTFYGAPPDLHTEVEKALAELSR